MRSKRIFPWLLVGILMGVTGSARGARAKVTLEEVGNQVYCRCGCVTTLNHCPHLLSQCESRAEITAIILKDIKQGKSDPEILQHLTAVFGVRILAAPPARGFDLAAWILPGAALAIGLAVVIMVVLRLCRQLPAGPPREEPPVDVDPKIMAAIEEEMNRTVP